MKNLMLICFLLVSLSSWATWVEIAENQGRQLINTARRHATLCPRTTDNGNPSLDD